MQQQYQCSNCGAPVALGVRFCGNCGALLAVGAKGGRGTSPWLRILVVFVAVVFLFGGISLAFGSCSPATTSPPSLPTSVPVINSFTANPTSINEGDSCTLAWDVTGAAAVAIDNGIGAVPASGDIETRPSTTTTYTLIAATTSRVTKSVTVTVTASPTPVTEPASLPPVTEPAWSPPERKYDSSLPTQMGAFRGKALWGDKPLVRGKVIAGKKNPNYEVIYIDEVITDTTDDEGNYELWVYPGMYYIGCIMPGSDRISYLGGYGHEVEIREAVTVNLHALDWSIKLLSPGVIQRGTDIITTENPPTLVWEEYDWAKYGETGYYQVEISTDDNDYFHSTVVQGKTESTSYAVPNPLKTGRYSWQVKAYTKTGKPIAGYIDKRYFLVP